MMTITKGESIFIDFRYSQGTAIPPGYTGTWQIIQNEATIAEGIMNMSLDGTKFELRIPGATTLPLRGAYKLLVAIKNDTTGYCDYILNDVLNVTL